MRAALVGARATSCCAGRPPPRARRRAYGADRPASRPSVPTLPRSRLPRRRRPPGRRRLRAGLPAVGAAPARGVARAPLGGRADGPASACRCTWRTTPTSPPWERPRSAPGPRAPTWPTSPSRPASGPACAPRSPGAGAHSLAEVGHTVIDWRAWRRGRRRHSRSWGRAAGWPAWPARPGWANSTPARWRRRRPAATPGRPPSGRAPSPPAPSAWQPRHVLLPDAVVIGGGLGRRRGVLRPDPRAGAASARHHPANLAIVPSALGDDAGLAGAAAWVAANGPV